MDAGLCHVTSIDSSCRIVSGLDSVCTAKPTDHVLKTVTTYSEYELCCVCSAQREGLLTESAPDEASLTALSCGTMSVHHSPVETVLFQYAISLLSVQPF